MAPTGSKDPVITEDYILQRAYAIVDKKCRQSNIFQKNDDALIPRFQRSGTSQSGDIYPYSTLLGLIILNYVRDPVRFSTWKGWLLYGQ
jgi:hypothetical protein